MNWYGYETLKAKALKARLGVQENDDTVSYKEPTTGSSITVTDLGMTTDIIYTWGGSVQYQITIWKMQPNNPIPLIMAALVGELIMVGKANGV